MMEENYKAIKDDWCCTITKTTLRRSFGLNESELNSMDINWIKVKPKLN